MGYNAFALQAAKLSLIPCTPNSPWIGPGVILELRARGKPWALLGMVCKQNKIRMFLFYCNSVVYEKQTQNSLSKSTYIGDSIVGRVFALLVKYLRSIPSTSYGSLIQKKAWSPTKCIPLKQIKYTHKSVDPNCSGNNILKIKWFWVGKYLNLSSSFLCHAGEYSSQSFRNTLPGGAGWGAVYYSHLFLTMKKKNTSINSLVRQNLSYKMLEP